MTTLALTGPALAQALLAPHSVAIVGASDDPRKTAGRPLSFMRQAGFAGRIYPINPHRTQVQGEPAWPDIQSLPEVPEHVFIVSPTDSVLDSVRACAQAGVKVVTILASGFAEAGPEGVAREDALRAVARSSGMRLIGPSSLGIVNPRNGLMLTANAAFAEPHTPQGKVMVASHSGSMIGALVSRGRARGVGFAALVSVGGEADASLGELCMATLDDPGIEGYALFLESLHHGHHLRALAVAAAARGKPVVVYKLGRSAAAADMVMGHTGAMAGEDDIADAFFRDCGMARVGILESLLEAQAMALKLPLKLATTHRRVAVVTTTGGGAAMVVDQLGIRGIDVAGTDPHTLAQLAAAGAAVQPGRVFDLTLAGARYEVMKAALDVLLASDHIDLLVAVVGSSARLQPELAVQPIIDSAHSHKPLAAMLVPDAPQALAQLTAAGVPCFRTPEACADVIAALLARRNPASLWSMATPHSAAQPSKAQPASAVDEQLRQASLQAACAPANAAATMAPQLVALSEAQAYAVLQGLGIAHAPFITLAPHSSATTTATTATTAAAASPIFSTLPFAYPVVVKACSAALLHKTELGGVVLGLSSAQGVAQATARIQAQLATHGPLPSDLQWLVQAMQPGLAEVLVGYKVDADAGPIVMLAAGGIWAEVAQDRSIRLAPVDVATALQMVDEVKALRLLSGLRGKPRGDVQALAQAVSALSQLAVSADGVGVTEAEINPLMVLPAGQGVCAVDALVIRRQ